MANLPNELNNITVEETQSEQPVSESVIQKIGKSINGLIEQSGYYEEFLSSGTWIVPVNTTAVTVIACGGGGGGGGGKFSSTAGGPVTGGGGGDGAIPYMIRVLVTPGDTYTVTIGAGGAGGAGAPASSSTGGNGGNGGSTIFSGNAGTFTFFGGNGGQGYVTSLDLARRRFGLPYSYGGEGTQNLAKSGGGSIYASGGAIGTGATNNANGGGGGASLGAGGNGGGATDTRTSGGRAAGGGGGGSSGIVSNRDGTSGGPGYLLITA